MNAPHMPAPTRSASQRVRLTLLRSIGGLLPRTTKPVKLRSVLLIRPDHLGDMLFLTPALHSVREALPAARITVLAGPWGAAALHNNPDVDALLTCAFPGFERRPKTNALAPYRLLWAQARMLRLGGYDAAAVLRFDHWWGAWLTAAAGIPRRVGYDWPETRPFLSQALPYQSGRHEVRQNATLLAALAATGEVEPGPTRYAVAETDRAWAATWLAERGVTPATRLAAIHPGAGAAVKQWPTAAWAAVAHGLAALPDMRILLTGSADEQHLGAAIATETAAPLLDAAGQTSLGQLAALYERCALVLGSDSGPLHLAVAVGRPTVHLYGPVSATKFGPWGNPAQHIVLTTDWPCAPCDRLDWPPEALAQHACMAAITPAAVLAAARSLIR